MTYYPDPCFCRLLAHLLRRRPYYKRAMSWRELRRARLMMEICYE